MKKKVIKAISFLFKDERVVVECRSDGKFRVPVTSTKEGRIKTNYRNLTAREIVDHGIIKNCDPTLYLEGGDRLRVFVDGDNRYLPAQADGIIEKHDAEYTPKRKKIPPTLNLDHSKSKTSGMLYDHNQPGFFGESWLDDWDYDDGD